MIVCCCCCGWDGHKASPTTSSAGKGCCRNTDTNSGRWENMFAPIKWHLVVIIMQGRLPNLYAKWLGPRPFNSLVRTRPRIHHQHTICRSDVDGGGYPLSKRVRRIRIVPSKLSVVVTVATRRPRPCCPWINWNYQPRNERQTNKLPNK